MQCKRLLCFLSCFWSPFVWIQALGVFFNWLYAMRKGEACPVPRFSFVKFVAQGSRPRRVARHSGRRCVLETHGSLGTGFEKQKAQKGRHSEWYGILWWLSAGNVCSVELSCLLSASFSSFLWKLGCRGKHGTGWRGKVKAKAMVATWQMNKMTLHCQNVLQMSSVFRSKPNGPSWSAAIYGQWRDDSQRVRHKSLSTHSACPGMPCWFPRIPFVVCHGVKQVGEPTSIMSHDLNWFTKNMCYHGWWSHSWQEHGCLWSFRWTSI